ncbi:MAG: B12-binding domain-containing radical SAM protein, partial [Thermodesulfobacteriota bacterium]
MRVHIIQPTHYMAAGGGGERRLARTRRLNLMPLTLPYLAALVPDGVEVVLTDERTGELDATAACDLVFISVWTINSLRAYEIAREYRARGVPVVMGGPHTFFYTDEVSAHADAVAIGEGEYTIPEIIEDFSRGGRGGLKGLYRAERLHDLVGLPLPRRELLDRSAFTRFHTVAVQTSRGCPNVCEFCTERFYLGTKYRMRPVPEVIEEIRATGSRRIFFADSTLAGKRSRTMELMEALIPLGVRWSALWTADRVLDRPFMELAKRSGLLHVNIGVESVKQATLDGMNKRTTKADRLAEMVATLRDLDISFSFNLIFGWDSDTL